MPRKAASKSTRRTGNTYRGYGRRKRTVRSTVKRPTTHRRSMYGVSSAQLHPFLIAQMDPFDPRCAGVRVPDASSNPSSAVIMKDERSITPSIAGNLAAMYFYPNNAYSCVPATDGAGSVSWGAAWGTNPAGWTRGSSLSTNFQLARPVAHGVRVTVPTAPTSTVGYLHVCLYPTDTYGYATWPLPTTVAQMKDLPSYMRITLASLTQNPLVIVNKFMDATAFRYTHTTSGEVTTLGAGTFEVPNSWNGILLMFEGTNSTAAVADVEIICHLEAIGKFGTLLGDQKAEPQNETVIEAASYAASNTPQHFTPETPSETAYKKGFMQHAFEGFAKGAKERVQQEMCSLAEAAGYTALNAAVGVASAGIAGVNSQPSRLSITNG